MEVRNCSECHSRKICMSWYNIRRYTGEVACEHGNYAKLENLIDDVGKVIANNCSLFIRG